MRHHTKVSRRYTTQTPAPQRTVRQALAELRQALHELIDPVERKMWRDGGHTTTHTGPSMLDQLRAAGGTSGESGGGGRGSTNPIPIDPDAVDLLAKITAAAIDTHYRALEHSHPTIEYHLRIAVALAARWHDPDKIDWLTDRLRQCRKAITTQLDPLGRWHIAEACPVCHVHMATRDDDGVTVLVPALLVDRTTGADCQGCSAHWAPEQFEDLAAAIRANRQEERA